MGMGLEEKGRGGVPSNILGVPPRSGVPVEVKGRGMGAGVHLVYEFTARAPRKMSCGKPQGRVLLRREAGDSVGTPLGLGFLG